MEVGRLRLGELGSGGWGRGSWGWEIWVGVGGSRSGELGRGALGSGSQIVTPTPFPRPSPSSKLPIPTPHISRQIVLASNRPRVKSSSRQVAHVQFVCVKSSTSNCPVPIRLFHPNFNWQSFCMRTLTGCKQVHQVLKDRKQN